MAQKRIGVLTSEGDCPGLNAVIRGGVKSAARLGSDVVAFRRGFEGLVDPVSYIPPTVESVEIIDAVNRISQVDPECSAIVAARALGVSFGQYPPGHSSALRSLKQEAVVGRIRVSH